MKRRIIYLLMGVIGTVGFYSCGPTFGTNDGTQDRTGTTTETTGTTGGTYGTESTRGTTGTTGNRSNTTTGDRMEASNQRQNNYELRETTDYTYENGNYRFTPDQRGINVTRNQDGTENPYGTMRSIGDDGYFIITTISETGEEEMAVGRFDEQGNFEIYRYNRDNDEIVEEYYRTTKPVNANMQNRGNNNRQNNN